MKTTGRFLILLVACTSWMQSQSQTKGPVQLADQYFAAGEYYTAAHLYEQILNPSRQKPVSGFPLNSKRKRSAIKIKDGSRTDLLLKQAESYRLANYWQKAATLYKECAEKNPAKYTDALYWYAVSERSLGNYAPAKESLKKFLSAAGTNNKYKEAAEKELETLLYIQEQLAKPDSGLASIQKLNAPNSSEKGVFALVHVSGNQYLISSTQTDSVQINGVNPHRSRLFYATVKDDSIAEMSPVPLSATDPVNNQGAAGISPDGRYLYFSQWKKEEGRTVSSIYYSVKEAEGWSAPTLLPSINVNGYNSKQPFCSKDGKYLYFASDRLGGSGKFDIWYAPLNADGTTGEPVNAGATINTNGDEQAPFYHNSSTTLVYSSNGRTGMGGYDLFTAKGSNETWMLPENMGHPINSSRDDIYFFAPEKTTLLDKGVFSSDRGDGCCLETYRIAKVPKPPKPKAKKTSKLVIKHENVITLYFDFDKSKLKPVAVHKLDSIYKVLVKYPKATIQISGYTDGVGSKKYNKMLSDKRARTCAKYLIHKGIKKRRITFVSFGACCPEEMELINGRDNPDGRSRNRRALINVKKD